MLRNNISNTYNPNEKTTLLDNQGVSVVLKWEVTYYSKIIFSPFVINIFGQVNQVVFHREYLLRGHGHQLIPHLDSRPINYLIITIIIIINIITIARTKAIRLTESSQNFDNLSTIVFVIVSCNWGCQ